MDIEPCQRNAQNRWKFMNYGNVGQIDGGELQIEWVTTERFVATWGGKTISKKKGKTPNRNQMNFSNSKTRTASPGARGEAHGSYTNDWRGG